MHWTGVVAAGDVEWGGGDVDRGGGGEGDFERGGAVEGDLGVEETAGISGERGEQAAGIRGDDDGGEDEGD